MDDKYSKGKSVGVSSNATGGISGRLGKLKDGLVCPKCDNVFIDPTTLECTHTMCSYCVLKSIQQKLGCPSCRKPIKIVSRNKLLEGMVIKIVDSLMDMEDKKARNDIIAKRGDDVLVIPEIVDVCGHHAYVPSDVDDDDDSTDEATDDEVQQPAELVAEGLLPAELVDYARSIALIAREMVFNPEDVNSDENE